MSPKKSIIFCAPQDYGISNSIKDALENEGFEVYFFPVSDSPYKYKNLLERLQNLYRKIFFKDSNFKRELKMKSRYTSLLSLSNNIAYVDFALFIRPDLFPEEFITLIKSKSNKLVGYQWDGLDRFPNIYKYLDYFDRFFVFDANDVDKHPELLPLTNFFIPAKAISLKHESAYFIGSYDKYRFNIALTIKNMLESLEYNTNFSFVTKDLREQKLLQKSDFTTPLAIEYEENINNVKNSSLVVDIHVPVHAGLSFRIFEALCFNKKLITTNEAVRHYDFYNPNNIFIWNTTNSKQLNDFLQAPFMDIPEQIKNKYSFSNWINYVLDDNEYNKIELPVVY